MSRFLAILQHFRFGKPRPASAKRRFPRRRRQRGVAFVLVLGALTVLTVMLTEVQDQSSAELASALEARDALVAEYAAKSAVNLSRLLIASEPTIRNGLGILSMLFGGKVPQIPVWNFADRMLGPFNDTAGGAEFTNFSGLDLTRSKNLGLPGARFELTIVDEDSKINVNAAARSTVFASQFLMRQLMALMSGVQYDPMFEQRDADGNFSDRQTICSALIDWADSEQENSTMLCDPTSTSAQEMPPEDSYYEILPKPYMRKNAAFDSLEELRLVRGVSEDFWATFVDPDPDSPDKRLVTVWGSSNAINVNTASPQTLLMLVCNMAKDGSRLCNDPAEIQKFLTIVTLAKGFTMGAPPFSSPKAFVSLLEGKHPLLGPLIAASGLEPIELKGGSQDIENQITTQSSVFSIYATGVVKSGKRETRVRVHTVVDIRGAPPPPETQTVGAEGTGGSGSGSGGSGTAQGSGATGTGGSSGSGDGIQNALRPNPAGNVVYFRMD